MQPQGYSRVRRFKFGSLEDSEVGMATLVPARRAGDMLGGRSCKVKLLRQARQQPQGEWMR